MGETTGSEMLVLPVTCTSESCPTLVPCNGASSSGFRLSDPHFGSITVSCWAALGKCLHLLDLNLLIYVIIKEPLL